MSFEDAEAYTDAQLLAHVRKAILTVAIAGQSYTIGGKTYTRANLKELRELRAELTDLIDTATDDSGGGIALVEFGERGGSSASRRDCLD